MNIATVPRFGQRLLPRIIPVREEDYDHQAPPLSLDGLETFSLHEEHFRSRLRELGESTFTLVSGTNRLAFRPGPPGTGGPDAGEEMGLDVEGYAVPINRMWSWFTLEEALPALQRASRPTIAFMPVAGGKLAGGVRVALSFLYHEVGRGRRAGGVQPAPPRP